MSVTEVSIRDLKLRPAALRDALRLSGETLLTASGKPFALLIPVDSETLDDTLEVLRIAGAQLAVQRIRASARRLGLDRATPEQIQEIITQARKERRSPADTQPTA